MKRLSLILLLILGIALAGDFAYWREAVGRLRTGFEEWAAAQRRAGWTLSSGKPIAGGWPLSATLTLPNTTISANEAVLPVSVTWRAAAANLSVDLFSPTQLRIEPEGTQSLQLGSGSEIPYRAGRLTLSVPLNQAGPTTQLELAASNIKGQKGAETDATGFGVALLAAHFRVTEDARQGQPALGVIIAAESITMRPDSIAPLGAAFGNRMPSVVIEAELTGPTPPPGDPGESARQWRDSGGRLDITRFALGWGTLGLSGQGQMRLDDSLQPAGTGDVHLVDYGAAIDSLARAHVIGTGAALSARAVLSVVSQASDNSDIRSADVPVSLQGGILMLDHIPLVRLPTVNLP